MTTLNRISESYDTRKKSYFVVKFSTSTCRYVLSSLKADIKYFSIKIVTRRVRSCKDGGRIQRSVRIQSREHFSYVKVRVGSLYVLRRDNTHVTPAAFVRLLSPSNCFFVRSRRNVHRPDFTAARAESLINYSRFVVVVLAAVVVARHHFCCYYRRHNDDDDDGRNTRNQRTRFN